MRVAMVYGDVRAIWQAAEAGAAIPDGSSGRRATRAGPI